MTYRFKSERDLEAEVERLRNALEQAHSERARWKHWCEVAETEAMEWKSKYEAENQNWHALYGELEVLRAEVDGAQRAG